MKSLLIATALCFIAVAGLPQPDQGLRLDDEETVLRAMSEPLTTPAPVDYLTKSKTQGTEQDRTRLMTDILTKYNKRVNPDNVKLGFGVCLIDFRVREERNAIESYVWLRYSWQDSRLSWKPEDYGGVEVLRLESNAVWKPDVTLYNSADPVNMINCWDSNTVLFPDGNIIFVPPCKMTSHCELTLKKHPYGDQNCFMKFGSWTFDGNVLDLQFYNGTNALDLSQIQNSSGFEVVSTNGQRNERHYPCCPEPYPDLTFNVTIRKLPAEEIFRKL